MRKKRPVKARIKTMLSTQTLGNDAEAESAEGPCESPLSGASTIGKTIKHYPRGSVLFAEGQRSRGVYVLCDGRAKVSVASADGKILILRIAQPGELLGVNAALTGKPYAATAETLEPCRIEFWPRADLMTILDRDQKTCLGVAKALSIKLSGMVEHARLLLLSESAVEKLARLLLRWCDELGKRTPQGIKITSDLTHEEIAQMICASRETVTRTLNLLKRKHVLRSDNGDLVIRNRRALVALAHPSRLDPTDFLFCDVRHSHDQSSPSNMPERFGFGVRTTEEGVATTEKLLAEMLLREVRKTC